jgi:hypothetical protein
LKSIKIEILAFPAPVGVQSNIDSQRQAEEQRKREKEKPLRILRTFLLQKTSMGLRKMRMVSLEMHRP